MAKQKSKNALASQLPSCPFDRKVLEEYPKAKYLPTKTKKFAKPLKGGRTG